MKQPKQRNPVARQLRTPAFRKRTVRSRKTYTRKSRASKTHDDGNTPRSARPPGLQAARGAAALLSGPPGWRLKQRNHPAQGTAT